MKHRALGLTLALAAVFSLSLASTVKAQLAEEMQGKILLQVESHGEAWYILPDKGTRFYLSDGAVAYGALRSFGLGITNADISKIPIGLIEPTEPEPPAEGEAGDDPPPEEPVSGLVPADDVEVDEPEPEIDIEITDDDGDGLQYALEKAIGSDPDMADTDGDGYDDGAEVRGGYSPIGPGKSIVDTALVQALSGKILLQVQSRGEAWYVNPADGKRYYMKDGPAAYDIMRLLGVGASDDTIQFLQISSTQADCGTDMECFARTVENGQPAFITESSNEENYGMFLDSVRKLETQLTPDGLVYGETQEKLEYYYSDEQRDALLAQEKTEDEIDLQIATVNAGEALTLKTMVACANLDRTELADAIRRWEEGKIDNDKNLNIAGSGIQIKGDYEKFGYCLQELRE